MADMNFALTASLGISMCSSSSTIQTSSVDSMQNFFKAFGEKLILSYDCVYEVVLDCSIQYLKSKADRTWEISPMIFLEVLRK